MVTWNDISFFPVNFLTTLLQTNYVSSCYRKILSSSLSTTKKNLMKLEDDRDKLLTASASLIVYANNLMLALFFLLE